MPGLTTVPSARVRDMEIYGTGNERWSFTTEADAGAFGIAVVTSHDAENGGFVKLVSCEHSLRELAEIYQRVHPEAELRFRGGGSVVELERSAVAARERLGRRNFGQYHRMFFQLFTITGRWSLGEVDNGKFPELRATGMEVFLTQNLEI